jgi:hypothetical protein
MFLRNVPTSPHGVSSQKINIIILIAMRTLNIIIGKPFLDQNLKL